MIRYYYLFSVFIFIILGCSDKIANVNEDEKILELVYSDYKYPQNFFIENLNGANIYYVNSLSITPLGERTSSSTELSTNNRDTAYYWSELTYLNSSYYRTFVDERETERYFEFKRVSEQNPHDVVLFRVHKSDYLDRSMYDSFNQGKIIGKYNGKSFEVDDIKELIEYLIFVKTYNDGSYKVLNSVCNEKDDKFVHTITEILIAYGDWGIRDEIKLYDTRYVVDKASRRISLEKKLIKTISGRDN